MAKIQQAAISHLVPWFINNIKYGNGNRLTEGQRAIVLELMNSKDCDFDFKEVVKKLELFSEQFNYEADFKVPANSTICKLSKLDKGKEWKNVLEEHIGNMIVIIWRTCCVRRLLGHTARLDLK